jgi:hypothetical protein
MPIDTTCPGCRMTFGHLDALMAFSVDLEQGVTGCDERTAALHCLAAVLSWWMDRSLARFPDRDQGRRAVAQAIVSAYGEHGIVVGGGPHG